MVVLQTTRTQYTGKPRPSLSGMFGPHRPRSSNTRTDCIGAGDFYPQTSCPPVSDDFHHVANSASLVRLCVTCRTSKTARKAHICGSSRVATLCVTSAPLASAQAGAAHAGASLPDSLPRSLQHYRPAMAPRACPSAAKCADRRGCGRSTPHVAYTPSPCPPIAIRARSRRAFPSPPQTSPRRSASSTCIWAYDSARSLPRRTSSSLPKSQHGLMTRRVISAIAVWMTATTGN